MTPLHWILIPLAMFPCCRLPVGEQAALAVPPGERFYVLLFGSQTCPKLPCLTHTFAAIVKSAPDPARPGTVVLEPHTISWVPANLRVRTLALRPEAGANLTLEETLEWALGTGQRVSLWGPYELKPEIARDIFARSLKQKARLESGQVLYKAIDPDRGPGRLYISDCIHAITDIDLQQDRGYYAEFRRFGDDASEFIVHVLAQRGRIDPRLTHPEIAAGLGLDAYPIAHRAYHPRPWWR